MSESEFLWNNELKPETLAALRQRQREALARGQGLAAAGAAWRLGTGRRRPKAASADSQY